MKHLEELGRQIAARNVRHIFGIPGSGPSLELLDALEKHGVRFHLTHFEGSGALMAGANGKLSGRSGVAISIKGPGLANMLPGLAACALDAFPVVSISEAYLPQTSPEISHKRIDHQKLLAAIAKCQCYLSEEGPDFEHLCELAESEIPGVVHLDIAASPAKEFDSYFPAKTKENGVDDWKRAQQLLRKSNRPAIIAGTLATRAKWHEKLNRLMVPVFSTAAAKGAVDETMLHAAGVYTGVGGTISPEARILPEADLIVAVGLRHNEVLAVKPFYCSSVHIDPLGQSHSFGFRFNSTIEGTPSQIEALFNLLSEKKWGLDLIEKAIQKLREKLFASSFLPAHVYSYVAKHFQNEIRLVLDTGNFCTIAEHAWRVRRPDLYLASGQGRYMGVSIPLGIGAAIYDSTKPTVIFAGDGGIGMFVAEIKLAVQEHLPLLIVLLTDSYLGTIRGGSLQKGFSQHPAFISQPSWLKAIAGLGVPAARAEKIDQIEKFLSDWDQKGPFFIEIPFDPDEYQHMTDGIR
jgi:acetolactate synthase-1/2/3 large subunit